MNFLELVNKRCSIRSYKSDPVSDEMLEQVLEAARLAPSAKNLQPFEFIVLHTQGREEALSQIYNRPWFVQAPILICACTIESKGWVRPDDARNYSMVDLAIAFEHLLLAATELDLGTCWVANFNVEVACKILALPEGVVPIAFTPLGFPADAGRPKKRKSLEELVHHDRW